MSSRRIRPDYRIRTKIERPDPKRYEGFSKYPTASISDAFRKRQTLPPAIKPVWGPVPTVVGPAITVRATPGDEIMALKAITTAQSGDVIVVAGANHPLNCFWGGIMSTEAKTRGVVALVADGLTRDLAQCREVGFPIWALGTTPAAPNMDVPPGELNFPIEIGGVTIHPGDLVVADEDGVVIVPQAEIEATAAAVETQLANEEKLLEELRRNGKLEDITEPFLAKRVVEYFD